MKERIVRIARVKFFRYGFYKVSIDSVVAELRTSKSTIYNHFKTKDDLVYEVLIRLNQEIDSELEKITGDSSLNIIEKLTAITEYTSVLFETTSDEFLNDLKTYLPEMWDEYQKMREMRINKFYKRLFEEGINEKIIRNDVDMKIMLLAYFKLTEIAVSFNKVNEFKIETHQLYQQITGIFLEGILVKK